MKGFVAGLLQGSLVGLLLCMIVIGVSRILADAPPRMPGDTLASAIVTGEPTDEPILIYTTPPVLARLELLVVDEDGKPELGRDLRVAIDAYLDARGCSCRCGR